MRTELRSWRRAWPRVGKATVDVEVEAEVVEEEEEAEEEEEERGGGRRRRTTLIKSNNPHLAGGEQPSPGRWGNSSCQLSKFQNLKPHLKQQIWFRLKQGSPR